MLFKTLTNLLMNVITYHSENGTKVSLEKFSTLNVLTPLIKSYLLTLYPKVQTSVCTTLAKLIQVVIFKKSTMVSLDLLLDNSLVRSILIDFGMDFELENLSTIHPVNSESIKHKCQLNLWAMKSSYVKLYPNGESELFNIMSDNKNLAGIYYWYNNINGKQYVGSADNLSKRLSSYYYLSRLLNIDNLINRAILKYGHFHFSLVILEVLGPTDKVSNDDLLLREQYYIDLYDTMMPNGYNMRPADRTRGFNHSDVTKELISSFQSGRTLSEETKAKISTSLKGRIFTDDHRLKISKAMKNKAPLAANNSRSKKVWVYDINYNLINNGPFLSVGKCSDYMNISRSTFYKIVDTGKEYFNHYYYTKPLN
jgi:group I intron endonuclease